MPRRLHMAAVTVLGLGMAVSAAAAVQQGAGTATHDSAERACNTEWRPEPGSRGYWRWEAYHNLDCAVAFIDERLAAVHHGEASEDTTVTITRDDLEHLRSLIRTGKDGAMRAAAEE